MKFVKAILTVTAILALAVPVMARNGHVIKEHKNGNRAGCFNTVDNNYAGQQLLARRGAGHGSGNGSGSGTANRHGVRNGSDRNGSSYDTEDGTGKRGGGYGPGDGTGNGGSGPRDGSGNGPKTGDCPQT